MYIYAKSKEMILYIHFVEANKFCSVFSDLFLFQQILWLVQKVFFLSDKVNFLH